MTVRESKKQLNERLWTTAKKYRHLGTSFLIIFLCGTPRSGASRWIKKFRECCSLRHPRSPLLPRVRVRLRSRNCDSKRACALREYVCVSTPFSKSSLSNACLLSWGRLLALPCPGCDPSGKVAETRSQSKDAARERSRYQCSSSGPILIFCDHFPLFPSENTVIAPRCGQCHSVRSATPNSDFIPGEPGRALAWR